MDIGDTIIAKSDQLNADDLISGEKIITVTKVSVKSDPAQPVSIYYEGDDGKPYKPCKSMRRAIVAAWGTDSKQYGGRSMRLYLDPSVKWAGKMVGGIRISALSHISEDIKYMETISRGLKKERLISVLRNQESNFDKDALMANADKVSEGGLDIYKEWFGKLSKQERQVLDETGTHERIKALFNQKPLWEVLLEKANNAKDEQEVSSVQAEFDARENEVDMDRQAELQAAIDDAISRIKQETEG